MATPNKEFSTDSKQKKLPCNSSRPGHHNRYHSTKRYDKTMSCLSPIQECNSEYSHATRTLPSHRRCVSAFSSLAELKVQQKLLQQNKPIQFTVGGNVRSECVMTAIPESHFVQKNRGPNEKDLELLGFRLPHMNEPTLRQTQNKCVFELRDENTRNSFTSDQRTEVSVEMPNDDEFHEEEEEEDDELQRDSVYGKPSQHDTLRIEATGTHDKFKLRGISFKKPLKKIARKVWRRVKPMLCSTRTVFKRKKVPDLQRSKGFLT